MGPTFADLKHAEVQLRHYDKALRLRYAMEQPYTILIERKTFRGRLGSLVRGAPYADRDAGWRAENGHVAVAAIRSSSWNTADLLDALKASDSWRYGVPAWQRAESADERAQAQKRRNRQDVLRYKTSELFDRYVWKYRQRVAVPIQVS